MSSLKEKLEQAVKKSPEFDKLKDYVQMTVTGEGLRIELIESDERHVLRFRQPDPSDAGPGIDREAGAGTGQDAQRYYDRGSHRCASRSPDGGDYSNWELSADRANAARRLMDAGRAAPRAGGPGARLRRSESARKEHPESASNRRISVIVRYQQAAAESEPKK